MKKINLFILIMILMSPIISLSQHRHYDCLTPEMNQLAEENDPQVKIRREALAEFTRNYIKQKDKSEEVYVIPVVFHVVHDYGPENISKEQIEDAIRVMNDDFRKMNSDTLQIIPEFQNLSADCKIEFRLAKIDPSGNCTEGITRTYSPLTYNAGENVKGVALSWPRAMYLNIWVVNSISGSAAAYAYYPGSAGDGWDGILCTHSYVGSIGTSHASSSRTLTHEIGHYLNLPHTWGSTNDPELSTNCSSDDGIADTPNTIGHTGCDLYTPSCGSLDNVQNYMEYSYCSKMYTFGQKDVMRAALNSSASDRNNLWTASNRFATGTDDAYIETVCAPISDFQYSSTLVCTGVPIQFYDYSYNTDTIETWNWSFPGGNPSISTDQNPLIYYDNAGVFDVSLTTINTAGNNTKSMTSLITVVDPMVGEIAPLAEGIESPDFPANITDNNKSWTILKEGSYTWQRSTWASASGNASLRIPNYLNDEGDISTLLSPVIILDSLDSIQYLYFKHAYARKSTSSTDKLKVSISDDCGATWHIRYSKSAYTLSTTYQGQIYTGTFTPDSTEWKENIVNLGEYVNSGKIRLKFECISGDGNWLYLDDIHLGDTTSSSNIINTKNLDYDINVFPNPFENELFLSYNLKKKSSVDVLITNIIGNQIFNETFEQNTGNHCIDLKRHIENINTGVYFVNIRIDDYYQTIRVICIE